MIRTSAFAINTLIIIYVNHLLLEVMDKKLKVLFLVSALFPVFRIYFSGITSIYFWE